MSNTLIIKSRKTGETFEFWMPSKGGYIRLESEGKEGVLGRQICKGGGFMGSTLEATPETFKNVCRNWYRAYMKEQNSYE
ncbi:hypothetical protein L4174_023930 (plasmid) [Photobacterium sp. CCB-ST2H9]|uniref:hypothetical protein n=1 Tax=Photobacterium sp. CCB-ST2H9 TaxID=2912855 RepID=UPI00200402CF|nr:hypothetical protein [Photobacterium sp. CCB-ST2H9]UTM60437.1 hypothetical protein L4174_023930 [Photobacterium sp. CCB-ST2H9]